VIPVMGYYEWLKKGSKEKIPHFTKRADGNIMLLAGLWSSVKFDGN
jgi:putative SOS response-associated peptidase YedK